jgi:hypothetical protein
MEIEIQEIRGDPGVDRMRKINIALINKVTNLIKKSRKNSA